MIYPERALLDPRFHLKLLAFEHEIGAEITLSSCWRSAFDQVRVGRAAWSLHLLGRAADVAMLDGQAWKGLVPTSREKAKGYARAVGFRDSEIVDEGDHLHLEFEVNHAY